MRPGRQRDTTGATGRRMARRATSRADRRAELRADLRKRVLETTGWTRTWVRAAAFADEGVPVDAARYVDDVHHRSDRITDAQIRELRLAGLGDDGIFELTVAAALGAGLQRVDAGLAALAAASADPTDQPDRVDPADPGPS